jgi:HSP20 family protein
LSGEAEGKEKKEQEPEHQPIMLYASGNLQKDFDRMLDRVTRDFEDFFEIPKHNTEARTMPWRLGMPSVDIEDRGKDFLLTVDLPGFKKEDVNVEVTNEYVTIQTQKREAKEEEDKKRNFIRKERAFETYYRRVTLPQEVNSNEAQANLNDGILQITLPKKEPMEKKKLTIT